MDWISLKIRNRLVFFFFVVIVTHFDCPLANLLLKLALPITKNKKKIEECGWALQQTKLLIFCRCWCRMFPITPSNLVFSSWFSDNDDDDAHSWGFWTDKWPKMYDAKQVDHAMRAAANAMASFYYRLDIACHAVMATDLIRIIYASLWLEARFFSQPNLMEKNLTIKLEFIAFIWLRI